MATPSTIFVGVITMDLKFSAFPSSRTAVSSAHMIEKRELIGHQIQILELDKGFLI
jgi:hypothetical protein